MSDMSVHQTGCDDFAARLADYLEGDAPAAVRDAMQAHAAVCASCAQLLADLESLPLEAAALPALTPSRDLWAGIAERIDARVLPLDSPRVTRTSTIRRAWLRPAAAAAALVVATAGITHVLTRASYAPAASTVTAATTRPVGTTPSAIAATLASSTDTSAPTSNAGRTVAATRTKPAQRLASTGGARAPLSQAERVARRQQARESAGSAGARLVSAEPLMRAEQPVYDREITKLRKIVRERRGQLDPKTVAVLEQSIAVIDSAIAQSRAALAKDPASGFLATQLNHSLEKKVELLRTAALLPSRT
jgi:hypothetical protein